MAGVVKADNPGKVDVAAKVAAEMDARVAMGKVAPVDRTAQVGPAVLAGLTDLAACVPAAAMMVAVAAEMDRVDRTVRVDRTASQAVMEMVRAGKMASSRDLEQAAQQPIALPEAAAIAEVEELVVEIAEAEDDDSRIAR